MLKTILKLEGAAFRRVAPALFAYLFRRIDQKQFIAYVDDRQLSGQVLDAVRSDGYVLKNCKLYAWAFHKWRNGEGPRPHYKQYEVVADDAALLRRLNLSHLDLKFESFTLQEFDSVVEDTLTNTHMQQHVGKLISRKMKFLIQSYDTPRHELEGTLKAAAVRALYMQYPRFVSRLHLTNTAKTTIHNTAMTLIDYHTNPTRNRLQTTAGGHFESRHVPLEGLQAEVAGPQYLEHIRDQLQSLVSLQDRMKPRLQKFLLAAAGHHDPDFSAWLNADNSDLASDMRYEQYMKKACTFFGYSEDQVQNIFSRIRAHLS